MKKTHIIALIVIAAAIGILITMLGSFDTYSNFKEAAATKGKTHTVIGHYVPGTALYDPKINANSFSFVMKDEKGIEKKVISNTEKPQDFERSEQIQIKGYMKDDVFIATDMQLKCPSKYQDQAIQNSKQASRS
jgi:cytochrome c-type biogenesis protein CcmE